MAAQSIVHKVFVYGTLKKGEPNHQWFAKDQKGYYKYLYDAKTTDKFPLIIGTKFNIPFVLYSPGAYLGYVRLGEICFKKKTLFSCVQSSFVAKRSFKLL